MSFDELQQHIENLFSDNSLEDVDFQHADSLSELYQCLNCSSFYITIHHLQQLKPIFINDKMRDYYGFRENTFRDIDYFYYFMTIHPNSYGVLLDSLIHFRKGGAKYLNLEYKLKNSAGKYEKFLGCTKSIFMKGTAQYAVTLLEKVEYFPRNHSSQVHKITRREREIIKLYSEGQPVKSIADILNISESTVKVHLKNIYKKLGVKNVRELTAYFESSQ